MLKPASLQNDYSLVSEFDDALDLPIVPTLDSATATPEQHEQAENLAKERAHKLKVSRERCDFAPILKPSRKPTIFTFRHVPGSSLDWWQGEVGRRQLSEVEGFALLFRLAIKAVDNLGPFKVRFDEIDGHRLLAHESLDELYAIAGREVVGELAVIVFAKTRGGVSPLS